MAVAPGIVSEELWQRIESLLPKVQRRFRYPGRKRLSDREALQGILFVLFRSAYYNLRAPSALSACSKFLI